MIITIDGPSSSGKSSVAKEISKIFDIVHIDSGAIYRAITFLAINLVISDLSEDVFVSICFIISVF